MNRNHQTPLLARTADALSEQFGRLVRAADPDDPIQVVFPGLEYPVHVWVHEEHRILSVGCPVTDAADWSTPGLPEFLLRESGSRIFGRLERWDDGIAIEHNLIADGATDEKLGIVVLALAHTAIRLERDLRAIGALLAPGEPDEGDD